MYKVDRQYHGPLHDSILPYVVCDPRRYQLVQGIKSINERPMVCYELSQSHVGEEEELEEIEQTWHILTALSKFGPSRMTNHLESCGRP